MKRVFLTSHLRGNGSPEAIERNMRLARVYAWYETAILGNCPYAPHLFYTQFLDELVPQDRELGIAMGLVELRNREVVHAYLLVGQEASAGMVHEHAAARGHGIPVEEKDAVAALVAYADHHPDRDMEWAFGWAREVLAVASSARPAGGSSDGSRAELAPSSAVPG